MRGLHWEGKASTNGLIGPSKGQPSEGHFAQRPHSTVSLQVKAEASEPTSLEHSPPVKVCGLRVISTPKIWPEWRLQLG